MKTASQKGFTLVELSIVLVIIGLLIGGILAAQSMITTTKIQSLVRQIGQLDAAVATYIDKFASLPGDDILVTAADGDNDGLIESDNANTQDGERGEFWTDLSTAGLKNEDGGAYTLDNGVPGVGVPMAKLGTNQGIYIGANTDVLTNYYRVSSQTAVDGTLTDLAGNTSANDGLAVDVKMDNGVADSGNVMNVTEATIDAATAYAGVAPYSATSILTIRIGSVTGDMK